MVCPAGRRPPQSPERRRAEIAARLNARRHEIAETILARLHAVSDLSEEQDVEYLEGLRAAVAAAIGYALAGVQHGEERSGQIPAAVLSQARNAARNRVGLDIVLRRLLRPQ